MARPRAGKKRSRTKPRKKKQHGKKNALHAETRTPTSQEGPSAPCPVVTSFQALLLEFAPFFSQPTFENFCMVAGGWLLLKGRHTITKAVAISGLVTLKHVSTYHRVFSRSRWDWDSLGRRLTQLYDAEVSPEQLFETAVDDTLARKVGNYVFGAAMHHDAVRSTRKKAVLSFGHNWVILSIVIRFPFAPRKWFSVPVLWRLFRTEKDCAATGEPYRKRAELALEMIELLAKWLPHRTISVVGDTAYGGGSVLGHLPDNVHLESPLRMDAALYGPAPVSASGTRGRPRKKGERLPTPQEVADDNSIPWRQCVVYIYGSLVLTNVKQFRALWYKAGGSRLLNIIVIRDPSGRRWDSAYYSTDLQATAEELIERYARRWTLEVTFRDVKQHLGFEDSPSRTEKAVRRTAPLALFLYGLVVLWFAKHGEAYERYSRFFMPWYRQKQESSFEDMLRALRFANWCEAIFGEASLASLRKKIPPALLALLRAAA